MSKPIAVGLLWSFLFICCLQPGLRGQGENNRWYFGEGAGLDFSSGSPVLTDDGRVQGRGSTVVSDENGELLFYTDGANVWDRRHQLMPSGSDLTAAEDWPQSVAVIPVIHSPGQYCIFTISSVSTGGVLRYTVVDLNRNGGYGAVAPEQKNIVLDRGFYPVLLTYEMDCGVRLITYEISTANSTVFHVFPIDFNGIGPAKKSSYWIINRGTEGLEKLLMAISPDGARLALSGTYRYTPDGSNEKRINDFLFLFNFYPADGRIRIPRRLDGEAFHESFGLAFSPNSRLLYTTEAGEEEPRALYQYDLSSNEEASMTGSRQQIGVVAADCPGCLAHIARGPDDRLYVARPGTAALGVIRQPNIPGAGCDYQEEGLSLGGARSTEALPNRYTPAFQVVEPLLLRDTLLCRGQRLSLTAAPGFDSYTWQDGASGPGYTIDSAGQYRLTALYGTCPIRDTVDVAGHTNTGDLLGPDTVLCAGAGLTVDGSTPNGLRYRWNDGLSSPTRRIETAGEYRMDVEDSDGCITRDILRVGFHPPVSVNLGSDTLLCQGESLQLRPSLSGAQQQRWQDGSTADTFTVTSPGEYRLQAFGAGGCTAADSIEVRYSSLQPVHLGPDLSLCRGQEATLEAEVNGATELQWSNGARSASITVDTSGTYAVEVSDGRCRFRAEQRVEFRDCCTLYAPNAFSPNGDGTNDRYLLFFGCDLISFRLRLFNRLGQLVFDSSDIDAGWNGLMGSREAPAGVYLYTVEYSFEKNGQVIEEQEYGSLNLVR